MLDVELYSGPDGEPLVRVTLNAAEVSSIAMWLRKQAENHTQTGMDHVHAGEPVAPRWQEAQGQSHQEAGVWCGLDIAMSGPFWAWANRDVPCPWPPHPAFMVPDEGAE